MMVVSMEGNGCSNHDGKVVQTKSGQRMEYAAQRPRIQSFLGNSKQSLSRYFFAKLRKMTRNDSSSSSLSSSSSSSLSTTTATTTTSEQQQQQEQSILLKDDVAGSMEDSAATLRTTATEDFDDAIGSPCNGTKVSFDLYPRYYVYEYDGSIGSNRQDKDNEKGDDDGEDHHHDHHHPFFVKSDCWYTRKDYGLNRSEARALVKMDIYVRDYVNCVESYLMEDSYVEDTDDGRDEDIKKQQQLLAVVTGLSKGYRGLEAFCKGPLHHIRLKDYVRDVVSYSRQLMKKEEEEEVGSHHMDDDKCYELLRDFSEKRTIVDRAAAWRMAQADFVTSTLF